MRQTMRVAALHDMTVDLKKLNEKFFTDPDWAMMEELILSYIDPLKSVETINAKMSNDQIATEVRGRQISYDALYRFLQDAKVVTRRIAQRTTFK